MAKSVLGDDPFAAPPRASAASSEETADKGQQRKAKAKRPAAKTKRPATKAKTKRPAAKSNRPETTAKASRPATKAKRPIAGAKAKAKRPAADSAETGRRVAKAEPAATETRPAAPAARPAAGTHSRGRTDRGDRPHSPLPDGASARRAARFTASLDDGLFSTNAAPVSGPGIDPDASHEHPGGPVASDLRRREQQEPSRVQGESGASSSAHRSSALDRLGQLLQAETYRASLSSWMMRKRSEEVDDFGMDPVYAERWRPLLDFLYHSYFRVETQNIENLPDHGRALIVANHSGTVPLDGAMLMHAVRFCHPAHRDLRPLVEDFVFHFPFAGVALNRIGCVRASQDNAERLLGREQVVAVFPEGIKGISKRFRHRYQLQRFGRGGFIKLALKTRAPIIPAAIIGAEEIYPMLTKVSWLAKSMGLPYVPITPTFPWLGPLGVVPLPSKWTIRFGEPVDLSHETAADSYHDRILVNRLAEQVRSTIQAMVDDSLSARRSVIFG